MILDITLSVLTEGFSTDIPFIDETPSIELTNKSLDKNACVLTAKLAEPDPTTTSPPAPSSVIPPPFWKDILAPEFPISERVLHNILGALTKLDTTRELIVRSSGGTKAGGYSELLILEIKRAGVEIWFAAVSVETVRLDGTLKVGG